MGEVEVERMNEERDSIEYKSGVFVGGLILLPELLFGILAGLWQCCKSALRWIGFLFFVRRPIAFLKNVRRRQRYEEWLRQRIQTGQQGRVLKPKADTDRERHLSRHDSRHDV
jgi:hypothetical protein